MAYDVLLAERIRMALAGRDAITERKMFGGIGFMHHGHMCTGVWKDSLIARIGENEELLLRPGVRQFDVTGRPMSGWLLIDADEVATQDEVDAWVDECHRFTATLPPK